MPPVLHRVCCPAIALLLASALLAAEAVPDPAAAWVDETAKAWEQLVVAPWRANAEHGAWDAEAPALLAWHPRDIRANRIDTALAHAAVDRIRQADCGDPTLVALCLLFKESEGYRVPALPLRRAWESPVAATVSPVVRSWLLHGLARRDARYVEQLPAQTFPDLALELITAAAAPGPGERARRLLCVEAVEQLLGEGMPQRELVRAVLAKPGLDRWTTLTLSGIDHITLAWEARGGGWASSVTEEGWKGFRSHLAEARSALEGAWAVRQDLPIVACRMLSVSLGNGEVDAAQWFERAIAVHPRYQPAWLARSHGLQPRWGGRIGDLLHHGRRAMAVDPGGSLLQIGWDCLGYALGDAEDDPGVVWRQAEAWPLCDSLTAEGQPTGEPDWVRGHRLVLARLCGQQAVCDAIYDQVGGLEAKGIRPDASWRDLPSAGSVLVDLEHRRRGTGDWTPRPYPRQQGELPGVKEQWPPRASLVDDLAKDFQATGVQGAWSADALTALGPVARSHWSVANGPPLTPEQEQAPIRARAAGCQDPGVLLLAALVDAGWKVPQLKLDLLRGLWQRGATASPYIRFVLAGFLARALMESPEAKDRGRRQALQAEAVAVATGGTEALTVLVDRHQGDPQLVLSLYGELAWLLADPPLECLLDAVEPILQRPGLDPWLHDALRGRLLLQRARLAGKGAYRDQHGMAWAFSAYRHLVAAARLRPDRVEPCCDLIAAARLARLTAQPVGRYWFDESVRRCYDYREAFHRLVDGAGSAELLGLAKEWAEVDGAFRGPAMAVNAMQQAAWRSGKDAAWRTPASWELVDRAVDRVLAGPRAGVEEVWLRHCRIAFAMACGKPAAAIADWTSLGKRFDPAAIPKFAGVPAFVPPSTEGGDPAAAPPPRPDPGF